MLLFVILVVKDVFVKFVGASDKTLAAEGDAGRGRRSDLDTRRSAVDLIRGMREEATEAIDICDGGLSALMS